jgi:hypothetical protein
MISSLGHPERSEGSGFTGDDARSFAALRMTGAAGIVLILAASTFAQIDIITYPGAPHLTASEGTIECWVNLAMEPDGTQAKGCHFFPFWAISVDGEPHPRFTLSYQTVWKPEHFHLLFRPFGKMNGQVSPGPYIGSAEDTQPFVKRETPQNSFPRVPRWKVGEWHHVALTWSGLPQSTVMLYIDGKRVIWPVTVELTLWDDIERFTFALRSYVHDNFTIDDLRISSIARTDEEMQKTFTTGVTAADRYTLLLDRFESLQQQADQTFTVAEIFTAGLGQPGGRVLTPKQVELVEGKGGRGLKILYR